MKTFKVIETVTAVVEYTYRVKAESKEDAIDKVSNGDYTRCSKPEVIDAQDPEYRVED